MFLTALPPESSVHGFDVMVADRYFVQVELQNQEPNELQDWIKRIDLKKLAGIK